MTENQFNDKQECFFQESYDLNDYKTRSRQPSHQLHFNLYKQLPAKQLISISRPQNIASRTLTTNKYMTLLTPVLNLKCNEIITKTKTGVNKLKFQNKQKLSIEEFFTKKQYRQVYNKLTNFPCDSKNFSGKLLSIDSVADYNHKMFRQLENQNKETRSLIQDVIDSDFQSGNLCKAFVSYSDSNEYFLMIENDINTYGYNIWFFFRFRNFRKGVKTFHLINMIKKTDNYKKGMQISIFSMQKYVNDKTMWFKGGDKINFSQTNFPRMCHLSDKYQCLSFQYDFQYDDDEVYFSMNQPYTYTRMAKHIESIQAKAQTSKINIEIKRLGHTLADNVIPGIRIWIGESENKETILITARQHPCETVGSFICQSMIDHLLSQAQEVKLLLEKYQVFIIPMVNPDGVIHGSSRCNLAGFDLNRQWSQFLIKDFTPQTHRIKKYVTQLHKQNPIKFFFDLHGHGKKLNSFFFSCKKGDNPSSRLIQLVMNKVEPRFSIFDCTYGIDRDKQNTVRSQFHQMGISHCYTLETSLMGYVTYNGQVMQFVEEDLFSIGVSLWKGIFVLDNNSPTVQRVLLFSKEDLLETSQTVIAKISQKEKEETKKTLVDENASDSDPEGDILDINERLEKCVRNNINLKKKITQTIKKQKVKKKKSSLRASGKKQQRKNSSNSENDDMQKVLTSAKIENQSQKSFKLQQKLTLQEQKKVFNKMSISNKRTVYSKKIREKQTLSKNQERPFKNENQPIKNAVRKNRQTLNQTEVKFRNVRLKTDMLKSNQPSTKTSSSIIYEYPNEKVFMKRKMTHRVKTEGFTESTKNIPGIYYHEAQQKPEAKYCELRQESLKQLLTDTFSVLKIKPKLSIKRYVKPNQRQRTRRVFTQQKQKQPQFQPSSMMKKTNFNSKQRIKTFSQNDHFNMSQKSDLRSFQDLIKLDSGNIKFSGNEFKYKRFENFVYSGMASTNANRLNSSVFYYFPVL